jgi:hypothetical protein
MSHVELNCLKLNYLTRYFLLSAILMEPVGGVYHPGVYFLLSITNSSPCRKHTVSIAQSAFLGGGDIFGFAWHRPEMHYKSPYAMERRQATELISIRRSCKVIFGDNIHSSSLPVV